MNLTDFLRSLDHNNTDLFGQLRNDPDSMAELKKNIGWLLPQMMAASTSPSDHRNLTYMFEQICNPGWSTLSGHPELQTKLLALVGLGRKTKHTFFRPTASRATHKELLDLIRTIYPDIKQNELAIFCRDTDIEELEDMMYAAGIPVSDHDKIRKQFDSVREN